MVIKSFGVNIGGKCIGKGIVGKVKKVGVGVCKMYGVVVCK